LWFDHLTDLYSPAFSNWKFLIISDPSVSFLLILSSRWILRFPANKTCVLLNFHKMTNSPKSSTWHGNSIYKWSYIKFLMLITLEVTFDEYLNPILRELVSHAEIRKIGFILGTARKTWERCVKDLRLD